MTNATNAALGDIQLAGDLAGNNNALAPELTATGVTAGSYTIPHLTLDAKGRVTVATAGTNSDITNLVPHASDTVYGTVKIGSNISWSASAGYVIIDFNGVLTGSSATGLPNFAGCITVSVSQVINGVTTTRTVSIIGANSSTITNFISEFNSEAAAVGLSVTISLSGGNLVITTPSGSGNTVTIASDHVFANMTGYIQVLANATGTGDGTIWIPIATNTNLGVVKVGTGLTNTSGTISFSGAGTIPDATTSTKGQVQIGSGLSVSSGVVSLNAPDATTSVKGVVQIGSGLAVSAGVLSLNAPDATTTSKGILQVNNGNGLSVSGGVLSYTPSTYADATTTAKGILQVTAANGLSITGGVLAMAAMSVSDATTSTKGIVQVGSGLGVTAGVVSANVATTSTQGILQVTNGSGLTLTGGTLSFNGAGLPVGTTSTPGTLQVGSGLSVTSGTVSVDNTALPVATSSVKGIASFSTGLTVTAGVITLNTGALPTATSSVLGLINVPTANGLSISAGSISLGLASTSVFGAVKVGSTLNVASGVIDIPTSYVQNNVANTFTKAQTVAINTLTDAATVTPDLSQSNVFVWTLAGNRTCGTPTNGVDGGQYTIVMKQDATGSRTITWPSSTIFKFRTGQVTTLSTAANATDVLTLTCIASGVYLADLVKGF